MPLQINKMFRAPALATLSALILAGCASSVPLEPTASQAPAPTSAASSGASGAGVSGAASTGAGISAQPKADASAAGGSEAAAQAAAATAAAASAPGDAAAMAAAREALSRIEPSIYFDFDSFVVKSQYQNTVSAFANYMRADQRAELIIEGNADERGTSEYNLALGQKRAEAVVRALGVMGVAENRVEAVSNGEEKPKASGSTEAAWAQNRRADIVIK